MTKKMQKPYAEEGESRQTIIWLEEIEEELNEALEDTYHKMLEDDDDNFLLKRSAILLFLSRFHHVYDKKLKAEILEIRKSDDEEKEE